MIDVKTIQGNSNRSKEERKEIKPIVKNPVNIKKKSIGKKIGENILAEDARNVRSYLTFDIIIPAIKNTIADLITNGIEMMLFGDTRGSRRRSRRDDGMSRVSYSGYYNQPKNYSAISANRRNMEHYDEDIVTFGMRGEAEDVLAAMRDYIDEYQEVTVSIMYQLVGRTPDPIDENWGWCDLSSARVVRVPNGYVIDLPRAICLK